VQDEARSLAKNVFSSENLAYVGRHGEASVNNHRADSRLVFLEAGGGAGFAKKAEAAAAEDWHR
jgi:hypothetical protein